LKFFGDNLTNYQNQDVEIIHTFKNIRLGLFRLTGLSHQQTWKCNGDLVWNKKIN